MKKLIWAMMILVSLVNGIYAQCPETSSSNLGELVAAKEFKILQKTIEKDFILTLEASVENSSWELKGSESAVLTIFVDGKYSQDILLFHGSTKSSYEVILGKFEKGKHKLEVILNRQRSAKKIGKVKISDVSLSPFSVQSSEDNLAITNAPFIYARSDTIDRFSDIPLITYYEIIPNGENSSKIRYTIIFTNEDGGTQTAALMARWGRSTDIEWVYEIETKNGQIVSEIYQGASHVTKNFNGQRAFGSHPLIYNITVNNNFADQGCSALRVAQLPIKVDLSKKSRETVMDENPWSFRIMAQEAIREGRINPENLGDNTIADLRDYVFAEVYNEPNNAAISIEAKDIAGNIYKSDKGSIYLRIDRKGYSRIAVQLPRKIRSKSNFTFSIVCHQKNTESGTCNNLNLLKIVTLDEKYYPRELKIDQKPNDYKTGEKSEFEIKLNQFSIS